MSVDTAFRERYASTPYHVMFGRAPQISFSTLASSSGGGWRVNVLDVDALRRQVVNAVEAHQNAAQGGAGQGAE